MTSTQPGDGGPAFPSNEKSGDGVHWQSHAGMSLRDWFAGQALIALASEPGGAAWRAGEVYALADAMLAEREKVRP